MMESMTLKALPFARTKIVLSPSLDKIYLTGIFTPTHAMKIYVFNKIGVFLTKKVRFGKNKVFELKLNKTLNNFG